MAEDQLAQVSALEGSRQQGRSDKAGQDTFDINQIVWIELKIGHLANPSFWAAQII